MTSEPTLRQSLPVSLSVDRGNDIIQEPGRTGEVYSVQVVRHGYCD